LSLDNGPGSSCCGFDTISIGGPTPFRVDLHQVPEGLLTWGVPVIISGELSVITDNRSVLRDAHGGCRTARAGWYAVAVMQHDESMDVTALRPASPVVAAGDEAARARTLGQRFP
jgi:hypothetical protein